MPLSVLIAIGFLAGWCASHLAGLRDEPTKKFLAVLATIAGLLVAGIALGEALRLELAYKVEELLIGQRLTPVLLAMLGGVVVYLFRAPIRDTLGHLRDIALVPGQAIAADGEVGKGKGGGEEGFKGVNFPWYVGVGLMVSIAVTLVLAFNPQLLKHVTSLKAGALEADFSGGTAAVQRGQMSILDPNIRSTTINWAAFDWPSDGDARYPTYEANGESLNKKRFETSRTFFETNLVPVFKMLERFNRDGRQVPVRDRNELRRTATQLAERMRADLLGKNDGKVESLDLTGFTCVVNRHTEGATPCEAKTGASSQATSVDKAIEPGDAWDPYVIEAVGDLLLLTGERPDRERFLAEVTAKPEFDHSCKGPCATQTAGQLSLSYAVVDAQVQSDRPWPFEEMIDKLSRTLRDIDIVLRMHRDDTNLQNLFRRNRLIDLSLGLQLFDQRAITGNPMRPIQLQIWHDWLDEVRNVLALDEGIGSAWPAPFDKAGRDGWRSAAATIHEDSALVQDAAIGTALSLVLLPSSSDTSPSTAECQAAKSAFHFAKDSQYQEMARLIKFDAGDKATYIGLLEQIEARLDSECGR